MIFIGGALSTFVENQPFVCDYWWCKIYFYTLNSRIIGGAAAPGALQVWRHWFSNIIFLVSLSAHTEAALHCFNLLKLNGGPTGGTSGTVSWDHFFASLHQYFANLRQESQMPSNMMDSIYR